MAVSLALAIIGVLTSPPEKLSPSPISNWAAAGFALFAAFAILLAAFERASRELGRRRWFQFAGIAASIWLVGQAIGYIATRNVAGSFDPRIETIPLLLAFPLLVIGLIALAWPYGLRGWELADSLIESAVAVAALWFVWTRALIPRWAEVDLGPQHTTQHIDQWLLFAVTATIVVVITASRATSSLPLIQLLLLLGAAIVCLFSDIGGEIGLDRQTGITYSIVGYWLGLALAMVMLHRPAAEIETSRQYLVRVAVSVAVPFGLVVAAGLTFIRAWRESDPQSLALSVAPTLWALVVISLGMLRAIWVVDHRARKQSELARQLTSSAELGWVNALLRDNSDYVMVIDRGGRVVYSAPSSRRSLASADHISDVIVRPEPGALRSLLNRVAARALEAGPHPVVMRGIDGDTRQVEVTIRPVLEIGFEGFVVSGTDVTDAHMLAERLASTGRVDALTGLLSPRAMLDEISRALEDCESTGCHVTFAVLDISDFGVWNDRLGRAQGDQILRAVADALHKMPEPARAIGRIGGDSFGLLIVSATPDRSAQVRLAWLAQNLRGLILADDNEVDLRFRSGYTVVDNPQETSAEQVVDQADVALRRARISHQAHTVAFRQGMNSDLVRRLTAELQIQDALKHDGVVVRYHPIVSLADGSIRSLEALARIRDSDGQLLAPYAFMDAAHYSGSVVEIDRRIRELVLADWPRIVEGVGRDVRISVNVCQEELTDDLVREFQQDHRSERLIIEVTESTLMQDPEAATLGPPADPQGGSPGRDRRFRDRLLVALADPLATLRHHEDRSQFRGVDARRHQDPEPGAGHDPDRSRHRARHDRRRRRDDQAGRCAAGHGLRCRTGFPVRPPTGSRRPSAVAGGQAGRPSDQSLTPPAICWRPGTCGSPSGRR